MDLQLSGKKALITGASEGLGLEFADLAAANTNLARRIAETRAELAASEAARQELVVGQALAGERERLTGPEVMAKFGVGED